MIVGYEAITNFPNGVDISDAGDVLIGDSHGNLDDPRAPLRRIRRPSLPAKTTVLLSLVTVGLLFTITYLDNSPLIRGGRWPFRDKNVFIGQRQKLTKLLMIPA